MDFFGDRTTADISRRSSTSVFNPGLREVAGGDQAVVTATDDDDVFASWRHR